MSNTKSDYGKREEYRSLPRSRQMLVDAVVAMMGEVSEWHRSWKAADVPVSLTGRAYRGENNVSLTLASIVRGYDDPRWMTFNQMRGSGWSFKTDENGKSMGKDAGVAVSFFVLRDKKTKMEFDRESVRGLSEAERERYMRDNVYPLRKTYVVFNASIVDGVPALGKPRRDIAGRSADADDFLAFWDGNMSPIRYGGDRSCYLTKKNTIRLPKPESFVSMPEFYSTAFHEISHASQGFTRPGVELSTDMNSSDYRKDELSAELSAVFMCQKLCGAIDTKALANSAAYLESWLLGESDEGKMFFDAVAEADKLCRYAVEAWEKKRDEKAEEAAPEKEKDAAEKMPLSVPVSDGAFEEEGKLRKARARAGGLPPSYVIGADCEVPQKMYDEHMSALGADDRERVEEMFSKDRGAKKLFFGRGVNGPAERYAADMMMRLASNHFDKDACVRVFGASVWKDTVSAETAEKMAKESTDLVTEVDAKLREYREMLARGEKPAFRSTDRGAER